MMLTGFHWLPGGEGSPGEILPASTFLDLAPSVGMLSPERLCRPYEKGRPRPELFAQKASTWHQQGCRVQALNEPNLEQEQFGGGPADYAAWFQAVKAKVPGVRLYWAGMSPGVPGWREWYDGAGVADGIAAHAYGTAAQMREVVEYLVSEHPTKPLWIAECNFGAGQTVDRDHWADDHLWPFLDWCSTIQQVEAVTYFAWTWATPDLTLPTPVDARGTGIEAVLRTWTAHHVEADVGGDAHAETGTPTATVISTPGVLQPASISVGDVQMVTTRGVDVSNNQGRVNLATVQGAGYSFVAIKASGDEGGGDNVFIDPIFPDTWRQAGRLSMPRIAYCYARPSVVGPAASVATLEAALEAVGGLTTGDNVALDMEDPAVPDGQSLHVWVAEWLALAERVFKVTPWKYSAHYYTSTHDLEHPDLEKYPTWWASYQGTKPAAVVGWTPIKLWQHSADGVVAGVSGPVDLNVFDGDLEALRALGLSLQPLTWTSTPVAPLLTSPSNEGTSPSMASPPVPDSVVESLAWIWQAIGPDVDVQLAVIKVKEKLGLQEVA